MRREKIMGAADTRLRRPPLLVRRAHPRTIPPAAIWESPEGLSGLPMQALWNIGLQESVARCLDQIFHRTLSKMARPCRQEARSPNLDLANSEWNRINQSHRWVARI